MAVGLTHACRYGKGSFLVDLLGCVPWDTIYKASGRREAMRYMIWIRLHRARKLLQFFKRMEKDVRINYLFTRIVKFITVELYCTHTAACLFYYLATTLPPAEEGYTWIGSLTMGNYKYINFREIDFWTRYITSLYFAIVTMATVGTYLLVLSLSPFPNIACLVACVVVIKKQSRWRGSSPPTNIYYIIYRKVIIKNK